ncbi:fimbrial protein [Burkholderia plantarii]|uniref:fimbrial protein n=1 Tax=Burkholderia plantarii TaxID=41899 RepID=UPI001F5BB3A4|nr:fimbrial protein [Burkholderia plantarii]
MTRIKVGTVESVRFPGSKRRERPDGPAFDGTGVAARGRACPGRWSSGERRGRAACMEEQGNEAKQIGGAGMRHRNGIPMARIGAAWRRPWRMFALLVLLVASRQALAQVTCTGTAEIIQVPMQFMITVPRDAPVGTVLSTWGSTPADPGYFSCTKDATGASGTGFEPVSLAKSGLTIPAPDGVNLTVWNTNVASVGLAIEVRTYANVCGWTGWRDLGNPDTTYYPSPWAGVPCNGAGTVTNGGQVRAAYVKTGPIPGGAAPSVVMPGVALKAAAMTMQSSSNPYIPDLSIAKSFAIMPAAIFVRACTTPDLVNVDLHTHWLSEFKGIGSATRPVSFSVALTNCPAGLAKIQYQFIPVTPVLDPANGVVALAIGSVATGVGLQLTDADGRALKYNTTYTLAGYNPSAGGSYSIGLNAALFQTAETVTPGSVLGLMTFTLIYQ